MRAVNHDGLLLALLDEGLLGLLDVLLVEVWALGSAAKDDEAMLITLSAGDSGQALLGDTHEVVTGGGGADGVDGDA